MASDNHVVIKIDVRADTKAIGRVRRELAALAAEAEAIDKKFGRLGDRLTQTTSKLDDFGDSSERTDKKIDNMSKSVDRNGKSLRNQGRGFDDASKRGKKFIGMLSGGLKMAFKAFAIVSAASALSLVAVNAAFAVGPMLMKAYRASVSALFQGLAVGAATAVVALSTLAAAQRETLVATNSARYGGGQAGLRAAAGGVKMLTSQTKLAVFGVADLEAAFANVSKNVKMTGDISRALGGLGDFAAATGTSMADFGGFVGELAKAGKLTDDLSKAAADISPEFGRAIEEAKKLGITSSDALLKAFADGKLSGEVAGTLDTVNRTLIGTAKSNFALLREQFGDFGTQFLPQFTSAFDEIGRIIQRTLMQIAGPVSRFFDEDMTGGIVGGIDRAANAFGRMVNEYLPKVDGIFDRIRNGVDSIRDGFNSFVDSIRPLERGGQILVDTFAPLFNTLFGGFSTGLFELNDLIIQNEKKFLSFGQSLANLFGQLSRLSGELRQAFVQILPAITSIVNALTTVIRLVTDFAGAMNSLGGIGSALMLGGAAMGYSKLGKMSQARTGQRGGGPLSRAWGAAGLRGSGGGGVSSTAAGVVNMTATTVYVNGPVTGPGTGRGGPAGGGAPINGPNGYGTSNRDAYRQARDSGYSRRDARQLARMEHGRRYGGMGGGGGMALPLMLGLPFAGDYLASKSFLTANGGKIDGGYGTAGAVGSMYAMGASMGMTSGLDKYGMGGMRALPAAMAGSVGGSYASSAVLNNEWGSGLGSKTHTATGIGAGAAGGAAAGAAVGAALTIWGGPTAAVGAAVGAAIGGVAGGIAGWVNSGKYKKQSKDLASDFVGSYDEAISDRLAVGDVMGAQKLLTDMEANSKVQQQLAAHTDSFTDKYGELSKELKGKAEPSIKNFGRNVTDLARLTGLSEAKIKDLAQATGTDLTGSLDDARSKITELTGAVMILNQQDRIQVQGASLVDLFTKAINKPVEEQNARAAVNEAGDSLRLDFDSGLLKTLDGGELSARLAEYMGSALQFNLTQEKDPFTAVTALYEMIGTGGAMYEPGKQFEGMGGIMAPGADATLKSVLQQLVGSDTTRDQLISINKRLTETSRLTFDPVAEQRRLEAIGRTGTITELIDAIRGVNALNDAPPGERIPMGAVADAGFTTAKSLDEMGGLFQSRAASLVVASDGILGAATIMDSAGTKIQAGANTPKDVNVKITAPTGFVTEILNPARTGPPDTATPRAGAIGDTTGTRLGRTMRRHRSLDSRLVGKRSITSSWRDSNLGSINSDHVTGNAYDLVGQNLGAYQTMVSREGGFAEFHGSGGGRHLHVVPGQGPSGDSSAPVASNTPTGTSQAVVNGSSYSFVINSSSANPNEIAAAVMDRIDRRERTRRERS